MPRTKLDKIAISRAELDTRIIKAAMARSGIYHNKELAQKINAAPESLSRGFKKGFSGEMKRRMHKVLKFTPEEREALGEWGA